MRIDVPLHHVAHGMGDLSRYYGRHEPYPMCFCKEMKKHLRHGNKHPLVDDLLYVLLKLGYLIRYDVECMIKLKHRNLDVISMEQGMDKEMLQRALKGGIITLDEKILIGDLR